MYIRFALIMIFEMSPDERSGIWIALVVFLYIWIIFHLEKKFKPFLLHFQTFLTTYKDHHQNWQERRKRMSILLYLILHSPMPGTTVLCVHHIALLLSDDCSQGRDGLLWWWGKAFCCPAAAVWAGFWQIQQGLHSYPTHTHNWEARHYLSSIFY